MFWNDHAPPHFHALYGENEAIVSIETFQVLRGGLPRRALSPVMVWAQDHRPEFVENWERRRLREIPTKIEPLP